MVDAEGAESGFVAVGFSVTLLVEVPVRSEEGEDPLLPPLPIVDMEFLELAEATLELSLEPIDQSHE